MKEKQLQEVAKLLAIGREVLSETTRLDYPAQRVLEKTWRKGLSSKPLIKGMLGMALLMLASCGTHRKLSPSAPPQSEPIGAARPPVADTSNVVVQNPRTLLDKVLGRKPPVAVYPAGTPVKAGKKSTITINNVTGGQTNTTNKAGKNATAGAGATGGGKASAPVAGTGGTLTNIEKAKAPVATGTGDATDLSNADAAANIKGDGNAPVLTNTAPEAPGPLAVLADNLSGPLGYVLAAAAVCGIVFLIIRRRARKAAENLV